MATSPRSLPAAIAPSTLRRASTARLPWWMPMGSELSFTAHRSWKISSARLRVLQKTSVVLCSSMSFITSRAAWRPECPAQGMRFSGMRMERSGSAPGSPITRSTSSMSASGASQRAVGIRIADRRRQPDPPHLRRQHLQPRHRQRQEVAAFLLGEAVKLVDDDRPQPFEHLRRIGVAQEQAERFGRGQEHLRRLHALPRLAVGGGVAGASLDPDGQPHFLDRTDQVAVNVDRERLERRDVEGVESFDRLLGQLADRRKESGQRLAGAGRRNQQSAAPAPRQLQHLQLMPARLPAFRSEPVLDDSGKRDVVQRSSVPSRRRTSSSA